MQHSKIRQDRLTLATPGTRTRPVSRPATDKQVLDSKSLFNGGRELKIRHNADTYRLTITKLGKLILTK